MKMIKMFSVLMMLVVACSTFEDDISEEVQVPEGSTLKLRCTHHGLPSDAIYWIFKTKAKIQTFQSHDPRNETDLKYFDGANEGFLKFRRTDHILNIPCTGKQLEGTILCSTGPSDDVTRVIARFDLRIEGKIIPLKPHHCSTDAAHGSQPDIHLHTLSIIDHEGDDALLQCRAHGNPRPHIEWFDPMGHRVKTAQKDYRLFQNGDLLIRKLSWKRDKGSYICLAVNRYGNDTSESFVYPAENKRKLVAFRQLSGE